MKSGKGNNNSRTNNNGGNKGKGKRKKVVNSQPNGPTLGVGKAGKQDKDEELSNGTNESNSNNLSRQWVNGDEGDQISSQKTEIADKSNESSSEWITADTRQSNKNSIPSTMHSSFSNVSKKEKELEEDKERWKNWTDSSQNYKSNDEWSEEEWNYYLLKEENDDKKYSLESLKLQSNQSPYDSIQLQNLGLNLTDVDR